MSRVLTAAEAAERLSVAPRTIHRWLRQGKIPGRKVGRLWLISEAALSAWTHGTEGTDPAPAVPEQLTKPIWVVFDEILAEVPEEDLQRLPVDGAEQHDHYIYGLPKKRT